MSKDLYYNPFLLSGASTYAGANITFGSNANSSFIIRKIGISLIVWSSPLVAGFDVQQLPFYFRISPVITGLSSQAFTNLANGYYNTNEWCVPVGQSIMEIDFYVKTAFNFLTFPFATVNANFNNYRITGHMVLEKV